MGLHKLATERQIPHCMWNLRGKKVKPVSLSHTASSHGAESRTVVTQGLASGEEGWESRPRGARNSGVTMTVLKKADHS